MAGIAEAACRREVRARRGRSFVRKWLFIGRAMREGRLPKFLNPPHNSESWSAHCVAAPVQLADDVGPLLERIVASVPILDDEVGRSFIGWLTHREGRLVLHAGDHSLGSVSTGGFDIAWQDLTDLDARGKAQLVQVTLQVRDGEPPTVYAWIPAPGGAPAE
jgi:hypothetical protein